MVLTPGAVGDDLRDFFHADRIATSIGGAVTVGLVESVRIARQRLVDARFDQAPVMSGRRPVGWVATDDLKGHRTVRSAMTPLDDCTLVSAQSSIASVLQVLPGNEFLFVVGKYGLSGFIVRSDLDRHAVRSYLYLLITGIEMLLAAIVKDTIPDGQIIASLRSDQQKRFEQAYAANQEASPAEYLYIGELITLFTQTRYAKDPRLWDKPLTDLLIRARNFRNDVMHPVRSLAASEDIEAIANLPRWATEVTGRLRGIVTFLNGGSPPSLNQ
jgi:CBS domain-containing protein